MKKLISLGIVALFVVSILAVAISGATLRTRTGNVYTVSDNWGSGIVKWARGGITGRAVAGVVPADFEFSNCAFAHAGSTCAVFSETADNGDSLDPSAATFTISNVQVQNPGDAFTLSLKDNGVTKATLNAQDNDFNGIIDTTEWAIAGAIFVTIDGPWTLERTDSNPAGVFTIQLRFQLPAGGPPPPPQTIDLLNSVPKLTPGNIIIIDGTKQQLLSVRVLNPNGETMEIGYSFATFNCPRIAAGNYVCPVPGPSFASNVDETFYIDIINVAPIDRATGIIRAVDHKAGGTRTDVLLIDGVGGNDVIDLSGTFASALDTRQIGAGSDYIMGVSSDDGAQVFINGVLVQSGAQGPKRMFEDVSNAYEIDVNDNANRAKGSLFLVRLFTPDVQSLFARPPAVNDITLVYGFTTIGGLDRAYLFGCNGVLDGGGKRYECA